MSMHGLKMVAIAHYTRRCSEVTILFNVSLHEGKECYQYTYCHGLSDKPVSVPCLHLFAYAARVFVEMSLVQKVSPVHRVYSKGEEMA